MCHTIIPIEGTSLLIEDGSVAIISPDTEVPRHKLRVVARAVVGYIGPNPLTPRTTLSIPGTGATLGLSSTPLRPVSSDHQGVELLEIV